METKIINTKIISQKSKYALRAIFELASRNSKNAVKISEIAAEQNISPRFLENILVELKQAGFVSSKRGNEGGYFLEMPANKLTVGQVIAFMQGMAGKNEPMRMEMVPKRKGDYAFSNLWQRLNEAISGIYNNTTFADLVKEDSMAVENYVPNYVI
jgi:Rrf2 family protein